MKIIERGGLVYARHWFKWYILQGAGLVAKVKRYRRK